MEGKWNDYLLISSSDNQETMKSNFVSTDEPLYVKHLSLSAELNPANSASKSSRKTSWKFSFEFCSKFWSIILFFGKKSLILFFFVSTIMCTIYFVNRNWIVQEKYIPFSTDRNLFITTRSCDILLSDSLQFTKIKARRVVNLSSSKFYYFQESTNHIWFDISEEKADCHLEIPLITSNMKLNITCYDNCAFRAINSKNTTIESLYINSNELTIKLIHFYVKTFVVSGKKIVIQAKDVSSRKTYISAETIHCQLTFTYRKPNFNIGYIPNTQLITTNIISQYGNQTNILDFINKYFNDSINQLDYAIPAVLSRSTPEFMNMPIEQLCFTNKKSGCDLGKYSMMFLSQRLIFKLAYLDLKKFNQEEFLSNIYFSFFSRYEFILAKAALQIRKNQYFVITLTDLKSHDLTPFNVIVYRGSVILIAAENFLQITSTSKFSNPQSIEMIPLFLNFTEDPINIHGLSLPYKIEFYKRLKLFLIKKVEELTNNYDWNVIFTDSFFLESPENPLFDYFLSELFSWMVINSMIVFITCIIVAISLVKFLTSFINIIKKEVRRLNRNELYLQQVVNEGFMFTNLAEITESSTQNPSIIYHLSVPSSFYVLTKFIRQFLYVEFPISEDDFINYITELQVQKSENKIEISKIFDAFHNYLLNQGIINFCNNQDEIQEALINRGLLLESNQNDPEFHITGLKIVGLQRGTIFKDKLFLSMDPNFDSLEYFITNHCKKTSDDSDLITFSEFKWAYSSFCKSTSSNKRMFDEVILKDLFDFSIKRSNKIMAVQGKQTYGNRYISLKVDLIDAISKDLPETKIIGSNGYFNSQANFGRLILFFIIINILEVLSLCLILSSFKYFGFMFNQKIIPTALALLNSNHNLHLSFNANNSLAEYIFYMIIFPVHPSTIAFILGHIYNIRNKKQEIYRYLYIFFVIIGIFMIVVGTAVFISIYVFEFFMVLIASFSGVPHIVDFVYEIYKLAFSFYLFLYTRRSIKNAKRKLRRLIDLYFNELINNHFKTNSINDIMKTEEIRDEEKRASEIVRSWTEQIKVNMLEYVQDCKPICNIIAEYYLKILNDEQLRVLLSEALDRPQNDSLVDMFIDLYQLKTLQIKNSDFLNKLQLATYHYTLCVCEGDVQLTHFFQGFYNLQIASQSQDRDLILRYSTEFLKNIVNEDAHIVIDMLIPNIVDIFCRELFWEFKKINISRLNKFLTSFGLTSNSESKELISYLPIKYQKDPFCFDKKNAISKYNLRSFWKPIERSLDTLTQNRLEESNRDIDIVIQELFPDVLSSHGWTQIASNYSKFCNIDENLLKFFCEVILTNNSTEVNYTLTSIKFNPYFKLLKRKFNTSTINLSGAMNISRQNFNPGSSDSLILNLFKKYDSNSIHIQLYFIHLIFNRKPILNHFIKNMKVIEPKLYHYCLTAKTLSLIRAYELYSLSNKSTKSFLAKETKGISVKNFDYTNYEEIKNYSSTDDLDLEKFFKILSLFLKIRNFDFSVSIIQLVSITPLLNELKENELFQLNDVIQSVLSITLKTENDYLPTGLIDAIQLLSTLHNINQLSVNELESKYDFLIPEKINWKIIYKFIKKFYNFQIKQKIPKSLPLTQTLVEYFSDEVKSPILFKRILLQLKPSLQLSERKTLSNIQFDETSYWKITNRQTTTLMPAEMDEHYIIYRVRSIICCLLFTGEEKIASLLYVFFHLKGLIKRKQVSFSTRLESIIGKEIGIDPFIIKALGQFISPQHSENSDDFLFPLKEVLFSHPLVSGNFQLKEIINSIFNPELINGINRIIKGKINFDKFFENEVKDKQLASVLGLLLELKTQKTVNSENLTQTFDFTMEKYGFQVSEVIDIYNLCKRKENNIVDIFSEGMRKETIELLHSFILAQSKLKVPDSETQKRYLQNNSTLFKMLGFNEQICWTILLIKRGNFRLKRRFIRSNLRDQALNSGFLIDLLEDLLTQTKRSCKMFRKGICKATVSSNIIQINPWIEKLLNLHKHPDLFASLSQTLKSKLTPFSYIMFLTYKYYDCQVLEFVFDFQFFLHFTSIVKKFKNEFTLVRNIAKSIEVIESDRKELSNVFLELIKVKRIFISYSKLILLISPCERELLDSLIEKNEDPEVSFNIAINNHLFQGWKNRIKDETMLMEINSFMKNTFTKPLQYYMFESKEAEVESLLKDQTYFSSFFKYLIDTFYSTTIDLSKINTDNFPNNFNQELDFGASMFVSIVYYKVAEISILNRENFLENYSHVTYKADLLFRITEKLLFMTSQDLLIRKEDLMKHYLFYFGIMLKPQHSLAFSPTFYSPSVFVYMYRLVQKTDDYPMNSITEIHLYFGKLNVVRQFEFKTKLLSKVIETDQLNSKNGQPLQMFKRYKVEIAPQGSESSLSFEYVTKLNDGKTLDLTLYKPKVVVDYSLLESFYILNVLVKGRPQKSFYRIFERLNPSKFNRELYDFEIMKSNLIREKFKTNYEDLFEVFFGLFSTENKKVQAYNFNYNKISRVCNIFDIVIEDVFEYSEAAMNLQVLDSATKSFLEIVRSLQQQVTKWDSNCFLSSIRNSKMKLKSDLTVLGVIFEYLFSPGLLRLLIRFLQYLQIFQH